MIAQWTHFINKKILKLNYIELWKKVAKYHKCTNLANFFGAYSFFPIFFLLSDKYSK